MCNAHSDQVYQPFDLNNDDIQTILNHTAAVHLPISQPADISFLCADIKYNNGCLKFCELGDAVYMFLLPNLKLEINGHIKTTHSPPWGVFWHYLKQFEIPFWFIGPEGAPLESLGMNKQILALDQLHNLGGQYIYGLGDLENNSKFKEAIKKECNNPQSLHDHRGIIIYCAEPGELNSQTIQEFKKRYPGFIFINEVVHKIVSRKDTTYPFFYNAGLAEYIPYTKFYDKVYNQTLVQNILDDFSHEYLVIKPVAGSASKGVIIIHKDELDATLATILTTNKQALKTNDTPWFSEWSYDNEPRFMLSEFISSQTLVRDGKPYDPTMRVIFMLRHEQDQVYVTVIGGFWKIPGKSLIEQATLTEQHARRSRSGMRGVGDSQRGILVEKKDLDAVRNILNSCLPILYENILTSRKIN